MRLVSTIFLCVFCFALAGCGDDVATATGPVGTWVPDNAAMKADMEKAKAEDPDFKKMQEMMAAGRAQIEAMPDGEAKTAAVAQMQEAEAQMKNPLSGMEATLNEDGTYSMTLKGEVGERGTWKLDGTKITFTTTESDGEKVKTPKTNSGTIANGRITYKPDEMPFNLVFKKK